MSDHKHKFELLTWEPDGCEEGTGAIIGAAKCGCGEQIGPTEIERRVNGFAATEQLQEASIEFYCGVIDMPTWRQAVRNSPRGQELIALAAATEEER